jgi:hypothetical protein
MASSPFSYGMSNFTSQFSNFVRATGPNPNIGLGGTSPHYTMFSYGVSQFPQMNPTVGGILYFNPGSNPVTFGWSNQPGGQGLAYSTSFTSTYSMPIQTNMFSMENPPLSS